MSMRELLRPPAERERLRRLARIDDVGLGTRLLRGIPTNEARAEEQIVEWSGRSQGFGRSLARSRPSADDRVSVVERSGGLDHGAAVIARYTSKDHVVELFTDSVDFCERLVDDLGWRDLFPAGSIRAAAIEHERAHEIIGRDRALALREAIGHELVRIGPFRRLAYVAGADELAAHAFAQSSLGLARSPLLITAAAMAALDGPNTVSGPGKVARSVSTRKEN